MKRLSHAAFLSLPLVATACFGGERATTGECPAGETCSDLTPRGLQFIGNGLFGELVLSGPRPTAIGGTQAVALQYDRGDGVDIALDMPFTADDDGGRGVRVDAISGSQVVVRGAGSRSNYLRILDADGLLMDRKELTGAALSHLELVPAGFEYVPAGRQLAFAPGTREIGVALYGDVQTSSGPRSERLVDTSMDLALAGATRKGWDVLEADLGAGTHALAVTAGDKPTATLDVVVVDHADTIAPLTPAPITITPNSSTEICFEALAGGRYVAGLTWTYQIDGGDVLVKDDDIVTRNCTVISTQKLGTMTLQVTAGNVATSVQVTVAASAARESAPAARTVSHAIATAGDRASM